MNRALIIIVIFLLISCGNRKSKFGCDFELFESTSGIKFPENPKIIDCYNSYNGIIWLHLKFETTTVNEFIRKSEMHKFSKREKDEIEELMGSEDTRSVDDLNNLNVFMGNKVELIPKNESTYLKRIKKGSRYVTYILNKESGFFWAEIQ